MDTHSRPGQTSWRTQKPEVSIVSFEGLPNSKWPSSVGVFLTTKEQDRRLSQPSESLLS